MNVHVITLPGKGQVKLKASDAIESVELFMYTCVHLSLSLYVHLFMHVSVHAS